MNKHSSIIITSLLLVINTLFTTSCRNKTQIVELTSFEQIADTSIPDDQKTFESIKTIGSLYTVNYYGGYDDRLRWLKKFHAEEATKLARSRSCSLFSTTDISGNKFFCRNFDRKDETPVFAKFSPPGKFKSFAFSPYSEVAIGEVLKPDHTEEQLGAFLTCLPFYATDGINEKGLAIGLAGAPARKLDHTDSKDPMFVLHFIREVLDTCENLDQVTQLINRVDLYDRDIDTISHHILIVEQTGDWIVLDYPNGKLRITRDSGHDVCRTNHFLEGGPALPEAPDSFERYRLICQRLGSIEKLEDALDGMQLLEDAANGTAWSVVYDLTNLDIHLAAGENYNNIFHVEFR
jgi:hypothetical protein